MYFWRFNSFKNTTFSSFKIILVDTYLQKCLTYAFKNAIIENVMLMICERCLIKKILKLGLFLICLTFTMGFYSDTNNYGVDLEELTIELGDPFPYDKISYINNLLPLDNYQIEDNIIKDSYGFSTKTGIYSYYIVYVDDLLMYSKQTKKKGIINVVDTISPEIMLKKDNFVFDYGKKVSVDDIATCVDNSPCEVQFLSKINSKKSGYQTVTIVATDESMNSKSLDVKIKIKSEPKKYYNNKSFNSLNVKNNTLNNGLSNADKENLRYQIINYALKFVGNPYVYGGTSLTKGTDCSGFTKSVYAHFGYSLPRVAIDQAYVGKRVSRSELLPGDIIVYHYSNGGGHVGIYIGNNKMVHAGTPKTGIVVAKIFSGNITYQRIIY